MILQNLGDRQVVYMPDIDAGHIVLGESMGLCDIHGNPEMHAEISKVKYTTDCGVTLDAWRMVGQTVNMIILPSTVLIRSNASIDVANALNSFNRPLYRFDRYNFVGKFTGTAGGHTIADHNGSKITTAADMTKDIPGIYDLMTHLGANNGSLFQPVIARYMWAIWHMKGRPSKFQPVGYFDLHDYLCVIRDDRRNMFSRQNAAARLSVTLGKKPTVSVVGVDPATNQALLEFGDAVVIDRDRDKAFRPFVLVANRPFELRQELEFRWSRVDFKGNAVFLMPVMSMSGTWKQMKNMLDLLSTTQIHS